MVSALTQSGRWEQLVLLAAEQRLDRRAANAAVKAMAQGQAWQEALRLRLGQKREAEILYIDIDISMLSHMNSNCI